MTDQINELTDDTTIAPISDTQLHEVAEIIANRWYGDTFMTPDQLCDMLAVKPDYIYDMVAANEIPVYKLKRLLRFRRNEIEAWLADKRK